MRTIEIRGNVAGICYSSGMVSSFEPKISFEIKEEGGSFIVYTKIETISLVGNGKINKLNNSWCSVNSDPINGFTMEEVRNDVIKSIIKPWMGKNFN